LISTSDVAAGAFAQGYVKADTLNSHILSTGQGSFAQGAAQASGGAGGCRCLIQATANGAFAQGVSSGNNGGYGEITASGTGSFAHGQARSAQAGVGGYVMASGAGSVAVGKSLAVSGKTATLDATADGSFAAGSARGGSISSDGKGSFVGGYADEGDITCNSVSHGAFVLGHATDGIIEAITTGLAQGTVNYGEMTLAGAGAFVQGRALGGYGYKSYLNSSGGGSFAQGSSNSAYYYYAGGLISASANGSFAQGYSYSGIILAQGRGSFCQGSTAGGTITTASGASGCFAQGNAPAGYEIAATKNGAFAQGTADGGDIRAGAVGAIQFGVGVNIIENSLQLGTGIQLIPAGQSRIDSELLVKENLEVWDDIAGGRIQTGVAQFYTLVGFYDKAPIGQPASVADSAEGGDTATQLNALLARLRSLGLIDI
jgi:hypothetical protein